MNEKLGKKEKMEAEARGKMQALIDKGRLALVDQGVLQMVETEEMTARIQAAEEMLLETAGAFADECPNPKYIPDDITGTMFNMTEDDVARTLREVDIKEGEGAYVALERQLDKAREKVDIGKLAERIFMAGAELD